MGWSPRQSQSNTKLHGILGLQKSADFSVCEHVCWEGTKVTDFSISQLACTQLSLVPTWVPLTRNIFRIKLTLCCKWFTSSKVSSWYRKHLPRLFVSWMPTIRGFRFKESHQNSKIALIRIQIIPKLPNIFKYIHIYFPNLSSVSSLHLLWATADSLWRPLVTNFAKFQSSEGLGFSSPPKPGISWHSPSERETKKSETSFVLGQWNKSLSIVIIHHPEVDVSKTTHQKNTFLIRLLVMWHLIPILSHSWKLLRPGKLTASALSVWCF